MEDHRGVNALAPTPTLAPAETETESKSKSFYNTYLLPSFSNSFSNFTDFKSVLAAVVQPVVSDDEDILGNLWNLHSEALADILDLSIDFDILEQPPPVIDEVPDWYINFLNSDREPAKSPPRPSPILTPEPPQLPAIDLVQPELPPISPPPPELSWEEYLKLAGLEEVEPPSDEESVPTTPSPPATPSVASPDPSAESGTDASIEPESSLEWQNKRRNWISKEKVTGSAACPAEISTLLYGRETWLANGVEHT